MKKWLESRDLGLLMLRLGVGLTFSYVYGFPKLLAGTAMWEQLGGAMAHFGITFWPVFWGLMASLSEGVGGVLLVLGIGTRTAAAFMAFTMMVAATHHISAGDPLHMVSPAVLAGTVFLSLLFSGSGRFALKPGRHDTI